MLKGNAWFLSDATDRGPERRIFWASVWLAVALGLTKTYHLGVPKTFDLTGATDYLRALVAVSYSDVTFAAGFWLVARLLLAIARGRRLLRETLAHLFTACATVFVCYGVANVVFFGIFGGFMTLPLLALVGDVQMVQSSVGAHLTSGVVDALVIVPLVYLAALLSTLRSGPVRRGAWWPGATAVVALSLCVVAGVQTFAARWRGRPDRRVAANATWVLLSSSWQTVAGDGAIRTLGEFPDTDLADFGPSRQRPAGLPTAVRRASAALDARVSAARRPPNVIVVVLESVAARWTSLGNAGYETTPTLLKEAAKSIVFDNAYAHVGRSSNSLGAMLLSRYPKLDFRELTEQFPSLPGTPLATAFRERGYRTAFLTPSDLSWAGWRGFLDRHGFADIRDYHDLHACPDPITSWGVEDRCMVDAAIDFIDANRASPFFLMTWTTQTHHPYEETPGLPELNLLRESTPDDWELGRYLNVLHETDRHLARLFDAVRRAGLEQDTLVVITGDHGQAFGYPHPNTYIQGRTLYQEDVNVPLMIWFPRAFRTGVRSKTIASHVDIAPTIAEMAGVPLAPDWLGRSLFDQRQPHRAYFYVAEDSYTLGVREDDWKYIYDLRDGVEELYDLKQDPSEQVNLAAREPGRSARLRQRLAAWTEANRRQYDGLVTH